MLSVELTEDEFARFRGLIYRVAGIHIPPTKRVLVANRVRRRLRATGIDTFAAYYAYLTSGAGGGEMPRFLDEITTNETYFFRDPQHYAWLGDEFLPEVARQARAPTRPRRKALRIWSAACATGEELYSIAQKVVAHKPGFAGWKIHLLGTDLSGAALAAARAGSYDARALRLIPPAERTVHFDHDPATGRWTVKPGVRSLATWKCHNLLRPLAEEPFDCIFLKNVLIYFDTDSKQAVVRNLLGSLAPGGYLVVGPTEGVYNMLGSLDKRKTWLYQRPA
jgi:chemotaxis protein methyltransferase CheR